MSRRDLQSKLNKLINRLSRLSIEQRQIATELVEATKELAGRLSNNKIYQQRETFSEYNREDRIVNTNSRNRREKRATVTRTERLVHNVRPIREEKDL